MKGQTMLSRPISRTLAIASLATLGIVPVVAAQTNAPATPTRDSMQELLAEVRGLRAEIRQATDVSLRTQLLVARLQLQEQRINSLSRQLADVTRQLSENEQGRTAFAAQVAMFGKEDGTQSADERKALEHVWGPLKAQLKLMEKAESDLQAQQAYLTGLIAEEQSRWATFNTMLDELSKPAEVKTPR
jgi:hypothetical protein